MKTGHPETTEPTERAQEAEAGTAFTFTSARSRRALQSGVGWGGCITVPEIPAEERGVQGGGHQDQPHARLPAAEVAEDHQQEVGLCDRNSFVRKAEKTTQSTLKLGDSAQSPEAAWGRAM